MQNIIWPYSDLNLESFISSIKIEDKNYKVFDAYLIALNNSRKAILSILDDENEKESTIFINSLAYRISMEMKNQMDDTNYKVKSILENALWVVHNKKVA